MWWDGPMRLPSSLPSFPLMHPLLPSAAVCCPLLLLCAAACCPLLPACWPLLNCLPTPHPEQHSNLMPIVSAFGTSGRELEPVRGTSEDPRQHLPGDRSGSWADEVNTMSRETCNVVIPIQRWNILVAIPSFVINNFIRRLYDIRFRSDDSQGVIYDCHYSYISFTLIVAINSQVLQ